MVKTTVISAFPACGKTYAFNNYADDYSMLDSDSSKFSWIKDSFGNVIRNPNFLADYINHISENIGKCDIIFVSSHKDVRIQLKAHGINFCTVYPYDDELDSWIERFRNRKNDEKFIEFIKTNWDEFMVEISTEGDFGEFTFRLEDGQYIDLNVLEKIKQMSQ